MFRQLSFLEGVVEGHFARLGRFVDLIPGLAIKPVRSAGRERLRQLFYDRTRQMLAAQESVGLPFQSRMHKVATLLKLRT